MDLASFLNYQNSYVRSIWRLLGNDPEQISRGELSDSAFGMVAYSSLLGKDFQEVGSWRASISHNDYR